ncbi:MAG: hypothetical protein HY906_26970 [Deltaproteobacteria bacterium]|nr:hypothetical protein [Deltaproteobacteria bacterium]
MTTEAPRVTEFRICGNYSNWRSLLVSLDDRSAASTFVPRDHPGYVPPVAQYWTTDRSDGPGHEIEVRGTDLPLLCQRTQEQGREHLTLILRARRGDRQAAERLTETVAAYHHDVSAWLRASRLVETDSVVPSASNEEYPPTSVSLKGAVLLELSRKGYPVPDFVIVTADCYSEWESGGEQFLGQAVDDLQVMTRQTLGSSDNPLIFALRVAMPHYSPGFMPTFLNVGATESALPGLQRTFGVEVANKILLNNLKNLVRLLDPAGYSQLAGQLSPYLDAAATSRLIDQIAQVIRRHDVELLVDPFRQLHYLAEQARLHFEANTDVLLTLSRGQRFYPSLILQKMVCSVRDAKSYAGVLFSRHWKTGVGHQLQTGHDLFGEEIMTGTVEAQETCFQDAADVKQTFPAVHHFVPCLKDLERHFESPVTIEFAAESGGGHEFFALLQLNQMEMTGRAAFISVVELHKEGAISRRRVTELICPYHVKQIESDTIDSDSYATLELFGHGISLLPRRAITARIYFSAEAALTAKKRGETVCFCKRTFEPSDTVVMREVDAIISLTSAAIHVVTICQSFGSPGLLSLEKFGIALQPGGRLVSAGGREIAEGDWITISSRRQTLFKGHAKFKPARLLHYLKGEPIELEEDEQQAFADMAYAYRYYQQLVRGMQLSQISKLNELIRLVNLELRGEAEEARTLVRSWFDGHESRYVEEVLASDMGDHLNQHTVFDMLTLDRKIRFFKDALEKCARARISGFTAGAFMLGRFISLPQPVAFWRAFGPAELALLVNEWVLFEKYILVLHQLGERKIVRAKTKILKEGLDELPLSTASLRCLIPLKLSGVPLEAVQKSMPEWCDRQTAEAVQMLRRPYKDFYDYSAPWSVKELEKLCQEADLAVPPPDAA